MGSKIDRNRSTRADFVRELQPRIEEMVLDHEASIGERMRAYAIVGRLIGRSGSWVRRLLGNQQVGLPVDTYYRAVAVYETHCARVEARAAQKMRQAEVWRRKADALRLGSSPELGSDADRGLGAGAVPPREAPS